MVYKEWNNWKSNAKIYNFGNKEIIKRKAVSGQDRILYEIGTGGTEYTRRNNIYDLAGNMSEWTTEEGDRSTTNSDPSQTTGIVAVFRGGSFDGDGSTSIAMRHAGYGKGATMVTLGFRVVLYIQL